MRQGLRTLSTSSDNNLALRYGITVLFHKTARSHCPDGLVSSPTKNNPHKPSTSFVSFATLCRSTRIFLRIYLWTFCPGVCHHIAQLVTKTISHLLDERKSTLLNVMKFGLRSLGVHSSMYIYLCSEVIIISPLWLYMYTMTSFHTSVCCERMHFTRQVAPIIYTPVCVAPIIYTPVCVWLHRVNTKLHFR